jgi:hypothetical protein
MEANSSLGWAAGIVVLDAVAEEHPNAPIVHTYGDLETKLTHGPAQQRCDAMLEVELICHAVELGLCHLKSVHDTP